jgi:5S rRNA maturation endonuclease (ribonuclease M5)
MAFDWIALFESNGIEYVRKGANVARNNVNIHCPFCGDDDPSFHMGVSLSGSGWGCWRNPNHRGKSRARLIHAVLNCTWDRAARLAGQGVAPDRPATEEVITVALRNMNMGGGMPTQRSSRLYMPEEFKPLTEGKFAPRFLDYMTDRGFDMSAMYWLEQHYDLRYSAVGDYRNRIVFPIYDSRGRLACWTARAVSKNAGIRYKTLSLIEGALETSDKLLLGLPYIQYMIALRKARRLVICEGPFDAIKVSWLGRRHGIVATCLFGLNMSEEQATLIEELISDRNFEDVILLVDPEARIQGIQLGRKLVGQLEHFRVPEGVEDPGALNANTFKFLLEGLH